MIYFTSDLHLGHARIIELCHRPFETVEEMNEEIIARWNAQVTDNDTVYVLGDAVMGRRSETLALLARLRGSVILVPGNHDDVHPVSGKEQCAARTLYSRYVSIHRLQEVIRFQGRRVRLCHFPYASTTPSEGTRYPEYHPQDDGLVLFHGHLHGRRGQTYREPTGPRSLQVDVGVDAWDFEPVPLDTLLTLC